MQRRDYRNRYLFRLHRSRSRCSYGVDAIMNDFLEAAVGSAILVCAIACFYFALDLAVMIGEI